MEVRQVEFGGNSNVTMQLTRISPTQLSVDGSTLTCQVSGGTSFINFVDNSGRLIASVNPQGNNLGLVTMTSYVQLSPLQVDACINPQPQNNTAVLGRRWVITPQFQPTSNVKVRLYYSIAEFNELATVANSNANPNDNVAGIADLKLSKYYNSDPALINNDPTDNCASGAYTLVTPDNSGTISALFAGFDANGRYSEFTISSFSEFWLHGTNTNSPLPVTLTSFSANCIENDILITWTTASELNSAYYILERSTDGLAWEGITNVAAAGTTTIAQDYSYTDRTRRDGVVYYRLRQVDVDGSEEVYGPISSTCKQSQNSFSVFPNPASKSFTVQVYTSEDIGKAQIEIYDYRGKLVLKREVNLTNGEQTVSFQNENLPKGIYLIRLANTQQEFKPVKLVIE
jgi:hypothetical protein